MWAYIDVVSIVKYESEKYAVLHWSRSGGTQKARDRTATFVRVSHRYQKQALVPVETNNSNKNHRNKSPELGMEEGVENVKVAE
jgi:hypothetical protein